MSYALVIVESPSKTKKIERYLANIYGKGQYKVVASMGHIRDLPPKEIGVDIAAGFKPRYLISKNKAQIVTRLRKQVKAARALYLAADPDREGEAIAWHLVETLRPKCPIHRVSFNAITESAIRAAFENPYQVDMNLVKAQETRRIIDRLVGYKVSPLLWDALEGQGLSAGRVQSVALRLVVERHRAIEDFIPKEYYTIQAEFQAANGSVTAKLYTWQSQKCTSDTFPNLAAAQAVIDALDDADFTLSGLERKTLTKRPPAPFTTSTLQQAAAKHLLLAPDETMKVAQKLYEEGLITYMRTDSPSVSAEAQAAAAHEIGSHFAKEYLPAQAPTYKSKGGAQEAHECIRPTHSERHQLDDTDDELAKRLYRLIWQRFIASQMASATYDQTIVSISGGEALFRVSGKILTFDGFLKLYSYGDENDEKDDPELEDSKQIPILIEGERLRLETILPSQHFSKPPSAFTQATLVKALEKNGVGRPSTFASTLATIRDKHYIEIKQKKLVPSQIGTQILDFLLQHFPSIFDVGFTAGLEAGLDLIASDSKSSPALLSDFWREFEPLLASASQVTRPAKALAEETDIQCPLCGAMLLIRKSKKASFYSCSSFPTCRYSRALDAPEPQIVGDCPDCDMGKLTIKTSKKGTSFVACMNFPTCRYSRNLSAAEREAAP